MPDTPETLEERLTRIKGELARVPALPGVYLWKNAAGEIIYVGKAKQLRARMRQYVNYEDSRLKIPLLVEQIDSFDYIVAENEHEALVLERNLINRYSPYFNADFKDDKSYPFIAITTSDVFPAIKYTREKHRPGTKYFGPYTDARAARTLVDVVRRVCPICSAQCADWRHMQRVLESGTMLDMAAKGVKPCFDHHMGGDSGHGGRTYFRIEDQGSTDIQVLPIGRYGDEGFEVFLGGDCELETVIRALKFITKVLEEEAEEVCD